MTALIPATAVVGDACYLVFAWNASGGSLRTIGSLGSTGAGYTLLGAYTNLSGTSTANVAVSIYYKTVDAGMIGGSVDANLTLSSTGAAAWLAAGIIVRNGTLVPTLNTIAATNSSAVQASPITVPAAAGQTATDLAVSLYVGNASTTGSRTPSWSVAAPYFTSVSGYQAATYTIAMDIASNSGGTVADAVLTPSETMRGGILGQLVIASTPAPSGSGTATMSGTVTLNARGTAFVPPALSGRGNLSGTATASAQGTAFIPPALSGHGGVSGTASLSGGGHLDPRLSGTATLTGTASADARGDAALALVAFAGQAALSGTASVHGGGSAAMTGGGGGEDPPPPPPPTRRGGHSRTVHRLGIGTGLARGAHDL